jgi:hypothetical protein
LTEKWGGNVHDKGVVEITGSKIHHSHHGDLNYGPRVTADLASDSYFETDNRPDQWICFDFKTVRTEPTHYTIRTHQYDPGYAHLKNWVVEGSDDAVSWTEIDRRENNSDINKAWDVKMFAVSRSGSFKMIRLRQTGLNHRHSHRLVLRAFEVFGSITGLE